VFFQECFKKIFQRQVTRGLPEEPMPHVAPAPHNIIPKQLTPTGHIYPENWKYVQDPDGGNRSLKTENPQGVLIHHTVTYNLNATVAYFKRNAVDVHFVIGHDGKVVQMANANTRCAHAGKSKWKDMVGLNDYFVGIELVNLGPLKKVGDTYHDCYGRTFTGKVRERKAFGHQYWEACTGAQEAVLEDLCKWLRDRYGIPPENFIAHYEASPGRKIDPAGALSGGIEGLRISLGFK